MQVKIKARQTLLDLAIQCAGTLDSLFEVARLNGKGITDDILPGDMATAPAIAVAEVADYFRKYGICPASATTEISTLIPEGIDFWGIEYDFIIS